MVVKQKDQIQLRPLRFLNISAASGLLLIDEKFYVIADDEINLNIFAKDTALPISSIQLINKELPLESSERKKEKPDFESLLYISNLDAILAIPSGSKSNRVIGVLIQGTTLQEINFSPLYRRLSHIHPDLNIEGVIIKDHELKLFSRGNGPLQKNQVIELDLDQFLEDLCSSHEISEKCFLNYKICDLGDLQGHKLCFTDATLENTERIWYLAAAENVMSTYEDGQFLGAVLGCMNSKYEILFQQEINTPQKPEGLAIDFFEHKFYVVTDADNRLLPAQMLVGDLPSF